MPNYSNGKIYKVVNDNLNICYIGSTVQPLSVRMSAHQGHHKSGSFARYKKWGKIEDCKIHLIENYRVIPGPPSNRWTITHSLGRMP